MKDGIVDISFFRFGDDRGFAGLSTDRHHRGLVAATAIDAIHGRIVAVKAKSVRGEEIFSWDGEQNIALKVDHIGAATRRLDHAKARRQRVVDHPGRVARVLLNQRALTCVHIYQVKVEQLRIAGICTDQDMIGLRI